MLKKEWLSQYNNGQFNLIIGQAKLAVTNVILLKEMYHVPTFYQYCVFFTQKLLTDHIMITHHWQYHMKILIEDFIMDGLEVFSQLHLLLEDMMLTHMTMVINYVNNKNELIINVVGLKSNSYGGSESFQSIELTKLNLLITQK